MMNTQKKEYSSSSFDRHFAIRNNPYFKNYIKANWGYFFRHPETIKIVIRKDNIYVHMFDDYAYCVIINDLKHLNKKGVLKSTKKDIAWLTSML